MGWKRIGLYTCGVSQRGYCRTDQGHVGCGHLTGGGEQNQRKARAEGNGMANRPLEAVYPFVFMDTIHYKIKENHRHITKAANNVLGVDMDRYKDILGIWIGENESAKF